jgi:hypothetical protein
MPVYVCPLEQAYACAWSWVQAEALEQAGSCLSSASSHAHTTAPCPLLQMPVVSSSTGVLTDASSVASFFSSTCAPQKPGDGGAFGGAKWDKLCTGCGGDCTEADPYYDYAGSFRCLVEGKGDVAFTKHDTVLKYAADGSEPGTWANKNKVRTQLLTCLLPYCRSQLCQQ